MNADAMLRRRVGYLLALDMFGDWAAQDLAFFARWMTELELRNMVRIHAHPPVVQCVMVWLTLPMCGAGRPHVQRG